MGVIDAFVYARNSWELSGLQERENAFHDHECQLTA